MAVRKARARLRRRFSNQPNTIATAAGRERLPVQSVRRRWIVGRELCLYRCADLANVPRPGRRAALALNIPVWSPFARTGHHCVWVGSTAMVWLWNADQVDGAAAAQADGTGVGDSRPAAAGPPAGARWLPEPVLHPRKPDGVHLQACHRGFELQHWRGGVLRDAYWQQGRPDETRVAWFAGRADAGPAPADLAVNAAAFATEPWATAVTPGDWLRAHERALVMGGIAVCTLLASWQEARIWSLTARAAALAAEVAQNEDALAPRLAARAEVRRLRTRNAALAALLATPSQPELMNLVDQALPEGAELQQWRYQRGNVALVLTGENLDAVACVEGLSQVFDDVTLGRRQQPGRVDVTLTVRGTSEGAS